MQTPSPHCTIATTSRESPVWPGLSLASGGGGGTCSVSHPSDCSPSSAPVQQVTVGGESGFSEPAQPAGVRGSGHALVPGLSPFRSSWTQSRGPLLSIPPSLLPWIWPFLLHDSVTPKSCSLKGRGSCSREGAGQVLARVLLSCSVKPTARPSEPGEVTSPGLILISLLKVRC